MDKRGSISELVRLRAIAASKTSLLRTAIGAWLLFSACNSPGHAAALPSGAATPLERFQRLFSSPPVIWQLVYSQTLPNAGRVAVSLEQGLTGATNQEMFEVRWQTNAMLHRELFSIEQRNDNEIRGECFSLWNDRFHFLDARTRPSLYVVERKKAVEGVYSDVYHAAHIRLTHASEILNLGVSHTSPGSIHWEGDHFQLVSMADKKPISLTGRISAVSNGVPVEIRVKYSNDVGAAEYRIAYTYERYAAPYYPSRIDSFLLRNGKEILYTQFYLLEVKTSPAALPESHFVPGAFLTPAEQSLLYLTNNSTYSKLPSGLMIEVPAAIPSLEFSAKDLKRNCFYYFAALAWSSLLISFGFKLCLRTKTKKN